MTENTITPASREAIPVAMTIAGSDSGGGAGIQADLKTFEALGVFGTSAITCLTAQNPTGVYGVTLIDPSMVAQQVRVIGEAFPLAAAKTGMLFSSEIIRAVAQADVRQGIPILVVDPVMFSAAGARLLADDALDVLCTELLPNARLITPNHREAELLCGFKIKSLEDLSRAAREIGDRHDIACVVKGGGLPGPEVVDCLYDEGEEYVLSAPRVEGVEKHGAGCTFSAAITAYLARGELLSDAVAKAKQFVQAALETACLAGMHTPLNFKQAGWLSAGGCGLGD